MAELRAWVVAATAFLSPVSPVRWWPHARRLAAAHGWMPTMMLWAILGVMLVFNFGIGRQHNIPWAERLNWLALASWAIVATLAMGLCQNNMVIL
jgi:hypothetical protein